MHIPKADTPPAGKYSATTRQSQQGLIDSLKGRYPEYKNTDPNMYKSIDNEDVNQLFKDYKSYMEQLNEYLIQQKKEK